MKYILHLSTRSNTIILIIGKIAILLFSFAILSKNMPYQGLKRIWKSLASPQDYDDYLIAIRKSIFQPCLQISFPLNCSYKLASQLHPYFTSSYILFIERQWQFIMPYLPRRLAFLMSLWQVCIKDWEIMPPGIWTIAWGSPWWCPRRKVKMKVMWGQNITSLASHQKCDLGEEGRGVFLLIHQGYDPSQLSLVHYYILSSRPVAWVARVPLSQLRAIGACPPPTNPPSPLLPSSAPDKRPPAAQTYPVSPICDMCNEYITRSTHTFLTQIGPIIIQEKTHRLDDFSQSLKPWFVT